MSLFQVHIFSPRLTNVDLNNILPTFLDEAGPEGFKQMERYVPHPYYETNFPIFPTRALEEEQAQFDDYSSEILEAVKDEPSVKFSKNHAEEILKEFGGYSEERFQDFVRRAKEQGCWE